MISGLKQHEELELSLQDPLAGGLDSILGEVAEQLPSSFDLASENCENDFEPFIFKPREDVSGLLYEGECWHCCGKITGRLYSSPFKLEMHKTRPNKMFSEGYFCGPPCVLGWQRERKMDDEESLFFLLMRVNYSRQVYKAAPPQRRLKRFGGPLSMERFRLAGGVRDISSERKRLLLGRARISTKETSKRMLESKKYEVCRVVRRCGGKIVNRQTFNQ
jgi:hypothetical protein